jgi:CheY-like chemotaxis protein
MTIDPAARRAMNDAGKAGERRARVLIVDDHPTNVDILVDLLKPSYELSTATSGEMAIEVARAIRPDLVLLDNMMPGMDGYATCRLMREMPETGRAKILMVSARARTVRAYRGLCSRGGRLHRETVRPRRAAGEDSRLPEAQVGGRNRIPP